MNLKILQIGHVLFLFVNYHADSLMVLSKSPRKPVVQLRINQRLSDSHYNYCTSGGAEADWKVLRFLSGEVGIVTRSYPEKKVMILAIFVFAEPASLSHLSITLFLVHKNVGHFQELSQACKLHAYSPVINQPTFSTFSLTDTPYG